MRILRNSAAAVQDLFFLAGMPDKIQRLKKPPVFWNFLLVAFESELRSRFKILDDAVVQRDSSLCVRWYTCSTFFLLLGSAGKPICQSGKLPSFRDFHGRLWASQVNLADNDLKIVYGRVHWEQLLENMRQAQFEEALRIVAGQHSSPEVMSRLLPFPQ